MSFLTTLEGDISKVGGFIVKEIEAAENLLGAKTGNQKLNLVVTAVEVGLKTLGIDVSSTTAELQAVINALVALMNKAGIMTTSSAGASVKSV